MVFDGVSSIFRRIQKNDEHLFSAVFQCGAMHPGTASEIKSFVKVPRMVHGGHDAVWIGVASRWMMGCFQHLPICFAIS